MLLTLTSHGKIVYLKSVSSSTVIFNFKAFLMKKLFLVAILFSITQLTFSQEKLEWIDVDNIWKAAADHESEGEYEKALAEITKIPVNDSGYISSLTSKSYYLINNEQYKEAIKVAEEGLASKYQNYHYYFTLNKIAGLLGLEDYDKSLLLTILFMLKIIYD